MIVNGANLRTLGTGFNAAFKQGLGQAESDWPKVATKVGSTTAQNEYGWLGKFPNIREWIGDRVVNNISTYGYVIKNRKWEDTVAVTRDDIEDDNIGIYAPMFQEMGMATAALPDQLVMPLLPAGFVTNCYDGQYFFDVDHPVIDQNGVVQSVSNFQGGSGTPWYLLDTTRALKPFIFQERRAFDFVAMDQATDEVVFSRGDFRYGVDGRMNAGYGFWQVAYGSKQPLTVANYAAARAAMMGMKGDYGRPLGIRPRLLVVPPNLEQAGKEILQAERLASGATNVWQNTAELLNSPWLA